mmetsp:Transcript_1926/g.2757  ORF Transcript_1926/g.2757 Transcript_1926/m.2757 type:complete len:316 (+) Transcript_1926:25-972(+)|eukprot:CAMPEP_0201552294 /NCGR_PEP_ID=MMETSP0173_2-20130828/14607_1 /ASSEMBLY_ACC=CAM_ASM_000268 /TAXON_ID=218659 /ORGANISM="Vexillifera sp., Strain DIVA3 564/2" /LENGTH=315 /DNA_ID=CAMNT_0047962749 /DNA_START=24 /DNA_END=971 /DNA_ORIENTATION=-
MGKAAHKAAGLMLAFSVFVTIEGVLRIINAIAAGREDWDGNADADPPRFAPIVLLLAALTEVVFGIVGIGTSLAALIYGFHNPMLTAFTFGVELCGWFTFIVFVFAKPAWETNHADGSLHGPDYSEKQSDGLTVLGILGSVAYCASMQGGQVFFTLQLLAIQKGEEEKHTSGFYRARHVYYSFLLLLGAVSGLAFGAMVYDNSGDGQLIPPVVQPPWFVVYPELTITFSVVTLVVALACLVRAATGMTGGTAVIGGALAVSWLLQLTMMVITQLALLNSNQGVNRTFVGGMLVVLSLALHIMPAFLDREMGKADD